MLFKEIVDARTHGRTDGRRTTDAGHWRITKAHLSTSCSGELKKLKIWNYESKMSPFCTKYNVLYIQKTNHITWYSIVTWSLLEAEIKVATRDVIAVRRLEGIPFISFIATASVNLWFWVQFTTTTMMMMLPLRLEKVHTIKKCPIKLSMPITYG